MRATTGTVAHTWRIRNFGSVREIFSTGKLYSDTFWCPPLLPDKQQPRVRTVSIGDSHSHHCDAPSSLVPMSWVIIIYPNGNNRKDYCSCYLRVVPTLEEKQRMGWKRDHMNFTMQVQVVQKKTKFGAPETVDLVTWTSDSCSFDAENPDWGMFMRLSLSSSDNAHHDKRSDSLTAIYFPRKSQTIGTQQAPAH